MHIGLGVSSLLFSLVLAVPSHHAIRHAESFNMDKIIARDNATSSTGATSDATNSTSPSRHLLVGSAGKIAGYDFDGAGFKANPGANVSIAGMAASWLAFREPNIVYAVDENSNATRLFVYDPHSGMLLQQGLVTNGSSGVVHLEFNKNKTRMVGSSYSQGQLDIWEIETSGYLKLRTQVPLTGQPGPDPSQKTLRAHQSVLDPSGRFFVVNDLGGDRLHVLDSLNDTWKITNSVPVTPPGSGPRHGIFISVNGTQQAPHYAVVCEITSTVQLFEVDYSNNTLGLKGVQTISTFGAAFPPANATSARAGEIIASMSGAAEIYITNRLTGNETDSISVFALQASTAANRKSELVWKSAASSGGKAPRHLSLSKKDQNVLFIANPSGKVGLAAWNRTAGAVTSANGTLDNAVFAPGQSDGFGPQFVMEI